MNSKMETDNNTPGPSSIMWLWIPVLGSIAIVVVNGIVLGRSSDANRGSYGDMFGLSAALFSALAFAALIYSLALQRHELGLQRNELRLQRAEMEAQRLEQRESRAALKASAQQQQLQSLFELDGLIQRHRAELIQSHIQVLVQSATYQEAEAVLNRSGDISRSINFLDSYFQGVTVLLSAWPQDLASEFRLAIVVTVCPDAAIAKTCIDQMRKLLNDAITNLSNPQQAAGQMLTRALGVLEAERSSIDQLANMLNN